MKKILVGRNQPVAVLVSGRWSLLTRPLCSRPVGSLSACARAVSIHSKRRLSDAGGARHDKYSVDGNKSSAEDGDNAVSPSTPAAPKGSLSIVFTDIVRSTAMWENSPEAMTTAMHEHDNTIRSLIKANKGYEVKQNGDGFMIAFSVAASALQFCLSVQERLIDQTWPEEILQLRSGEETSDGDGNVLFRGLRLRMSIHWGEPVCVWNDVVQRMDYLGPIVNRAARFIQVTEGGQIVVSEEFLLELQSHMNKDSSNKAPPNKASPQVLDLDLLQNHTTQKSITDEKFEICLLGKHHFKGLSERHKLYFIVPKSLQGRLELFPGSTYVAGSKGNISPDNK